MILEGEHFQRIKMNIKKVLTIPPMTVCLITYANLYKDENMEYFLNSPPNLIVFDEYHILTNNSLKESHNYRNAVMKLPYKLRIGLTATPFINNDMEAVTAFGLLNDRPLVENFFLSDTMGKKRLVDEVREKKFLFYKNNPYNFTSVSEWLVSIPMSKELYYKYKDICNELDDSYMKRLHQVGKLTISPNLVDKKLKLNLTSNIITGKMVALKAIINNMSKEDKIVIFDNYRDTLEYIRRQDFISPLKPILYFGGPKLANEDGFKRFEQDPGCRVLLTTRQKGGEGLNLQIANHLVLMNCWYTAKDIIQILGRIKRKGQTKPVYAYIFGYNLFECLGEGRNPEDYFLPEDLEFYKAIQSKTEMCEEWGIEVKTKLPLLKSFFKDSSFDSEFNDFILHEQQKIKIISLLEEDEELVDDTAIELNTSYLEDFAMQIQYYKTNSNTQMNKNEMPKVTLIKHNSVPTQGCPTK
jgi:SNF2 family DNA or RNA helicase